MRKLGKPVAVSSGTSPPSPQPAADVHLEDLPSEAVLLIAQHASTPSNPAACLLPLVCRNWSTAADDAQLQVDISVDLGPCEEQHPPLPFRAASSSQASTARITRTRAAAAAAAAAKAAASVAAAAAAVPAALLRGRQLAAWLAKRRGSVRSLCIPRGPLPLQWEYRGNWVEDLMLIRDTLTARPQVPAAGPLLPHLVRLELPVLGLPDNSAFLEALATCTGLQELVLLAPRQIYSTQGDYDQLGAALAPLRQLRQKLRLHFPYYEHDYVWVQHAWLARLLRQLPPSLEQVQMDDLELEASGSIPLSCITHLVHLRAWELSIVPLVEDDLSSSSTSSSTSSSSSGSSGVGGGASGLTALTSLHCTWRLLGTDARLQLPNLRSLHFRDGAEPEAWEQLQGMKHLRHLSLLCSTDDTHSAAGLGGMTQLQELQMATRGPVLTLLMEPATVQHLAAAIANLTQLKALSLEAHAVVAGGPTLLTPLTQLKALTVDGVVLMLQHCYPEGAEGFAATPAGAAVGVVAAAVGSGWRPLQLLVVRVSGYAAKLEEEPEQVGAAARAALPGVEVEVTVSSRC